MFFLALPLIDQVTRLRKASPFAPGCWMAVHHDRLTCGKTGESYKLDKV